MRIHKLEFYINPLKLFEFLNQGVRKGKLVMLQDATEKDYTVIAYGNEILSEKILDPITSKLHQVCDVFESRLLAENECLKKYLESFEFADDVKKFPFLHGLIGFFSYDFGLGFENILNDRKDDQSCPSYFFLMPEETLIWDHASREMWVVFTVEPKADTVDFYENLRNVHFKESETCEEPDKAFASNLTKSEFCEKISEIKEYLNRGETYQVNFSQRFTFQTSKSPWEIYKSVTEINPTKYQVFAEGNFEGEDFFVVCDSPERLFRITNPEGRRKIETRPIKGTIGIRGNESPEELKKLGESLVLSDKDRAELEMIVDMSRNDLGRVCEFGTVHVDEHRVLEKYSHLFHTVSNVSGILKDTVKLYDVLRAVFPGASITGCPKKRTMEIIYELEEFARGVYCGSFGYLDCRGNADFNIMIRTLFAKEGGAEMYDYVMHSGGGVVMDSDPMLEFNETFDKVKAFLEVL